MAEDLRKTGVNSRSDEDTDMLNPGADRDLVRDSNPDAITGAPGSHPIGTGIGAASAGAAGAMIGSVVPGIGTIIGGAIGAVVGAVAGGYAGKAVAEAVNPSAEDDYWRTSHADRPYYENNYSYEEDYKPAYQYGWESQGQHAGRSFEDAKTDLASGWDETKGQSRLGWEKAQHAARDAWQRMEGTAQDASSSIRTNLPSSQASDNAVRNPSVRPVTPASGLGTTTPPPLPRSNSGTSESRAMSDTSHRNTGTSNVQTPRGNESE